MKIPSGSCSTCRPRKNFISPIDDISNFCFITDSKSLHRFSYVDPKIISSI
ncbi:hypothetical protein HanRHA438_Chr10g0457371 [Helianthus annuus]|nr:hypothetical protein HanRHA438_Chr10g0457371 [Helianthus annuus]